MCVRAGAIIPVDPIRQFTGEKTTAPLTIRIYRGADGDYSLYEDDGASLAYLKGDAVLSRFQWNDKASTLTIRCNKLKSNAKVQGVRSLRVEIIPDGTVKSLEFAGEPVTVRF